MYSARPRDRRVRLQSSTDSNVTSTTINSSLDYSVDYYSNTGHLCIIPGPSNNDRLLETGMLAHAESLLEKERIVQPLITAL